MELFVKGVKFSTYFRRYHPIITIIITVLGPTLASVAVTLVAGEAGALVAADVVGAVREHITGSENVTMSQSVISSLLLTCICIHFRPAWNIPCRPSRHCSDTGSLDTHH